MKIPQLAVPQPPSVVRVALIWLTLSVASVAGFASAQPSPVAPAPDPTAIALTIGAGAGARAATATASRTGQLPEATLQWRDLVATHFEPRDVGLALRVIHCESSGSPDAINTHSGASGLFQHMPAFWGERSRSATVAGSIHDADANVAVAAWLVYEGGGWRHWSASRHCWSGTAPLQ